MRARTIGTLAAVVLTVGLAAAAYAQGTDVAVEDNSYAPSSLTVTAGQSVTWTQTGSNPHTVTADDGSFDSHPNCNSFSDSATGACMEAGDSHNEPFPEPGTYPYYCKIHGAPGGQGMSGTIVVQAAQTDGGTTDGATTDGGDTTTDGGDTTTDGTTDTTTDGGGTTTDGTTDGGTTDGATDAGTEQEVAEEDSLPRTGTTVALLLAAVVALTGGAVLLVRGLGTT